MGGAVEAGGEKQPALPSLRLMPHIWQAWWDMGRWGYSETATQVGPEGGRGSGSSS